MTDIRQQVGVPFSLEPLWAMEPSAFERLRELVSNSSPERLAAASAQSAAGGSHPGYENRGGVAVIQFAGAVAKRHNLWSSLFGGRAVTTETRAAVDAAVADPSVDSILMVIDSPGGTVDGVGDLADTVAAANKTKPVCAYAEDMCASAAYWIGSQASRFVGNPTASVGSIGVFAAVPDVSRLVKNLGIEMNVVKSVSGKGGGTMGAPVTDAQLAEVQRMVNSIHSEFVAAVSRGRGRDMSAVADGRVYMGQDAVDLGLIDAVEPISATIEAMQMIAEQKKKKPMQPTMPTMPMMEEMHMETPTPAPTPDHSAEIADLKASFEAQRKELAEMRAAAAQANLDREANDLIASAQAERRLTPALMDTARTVAKSGVEPLRTFLAALPVSAPAAGSVSEQATTASEPQPRHVSDHVGVALHAYKPETAAAHQTAIAFMEKANAAGKKISYFDAVVAVTRK
jgi:signal peptide peptidase SppA